MWRKKAILCMVFFLTLFLCVGTTVATDGWETDRGTKINISLDFDDDWTIDENNNVKITFELYELGTNVRDVHDINLGVAVAFPGKTYSDSAGYWTLDTEGETASYTFKFTPSSNDVDTGDSGTVYYIAEWKEDIAYQTDTHYDTDWQSYGSVTLKPSGYAKVQIIDTEYPHDVEENEKFSVEVQLHNAGNLDAKGVVIGIGFDEGYLSCTSDKQRTVGTMSGGEIKVITWHFTAKQLSFGSSGETITISISFVSDNAGSGKSYTHVTIGPAGIGGGGGMCLGTVIVAAIPIMALVSLGLKRKY